MPILAQLGSATIRPTRRMVIPPRGIVNTDANGPKADVAVRETLPKKSARLTCFVISFCRFTQ
jgi:hypothetical protein